MIRKWILAGVVALACAGLAAPAGASSGAVTGDHHDDPLKARLSGLNEIGPDGADKAGAVQGSGASVVHVFTGEWSGVCWWIGTNGIGDATLAHIHHSAIGTNGPVVVDFAGKLEGCTDVDPALANAINANPEDYYINVHTANFPGGAIRGQLRDPAPETELKARLNGANEVGAGDLTASGKLNIDLRGTLICWKFHAGPAGVTAQHIHRGAAGTNGPIVVDFDGNTTGCRDIKAELAAAILANPAGYYANQHTANFPAGAIRGQLFPRP